jgi:hypothetical protein
LRLRAVTVRAPPAVVPGELALVPGEVVEVTHRPLGSDWWAGVVVGPEPDNRGAGVFPADCVRVYEQPALRPGEHLCLA